MPKESNLEFKVGSFVLLALVALTIFIFSITDMSFFEKRKQFKVVFSFANGVKVNAPVRVAGVEQGTVKDINLFFDRQDLKTKVELKFLINEDVRIPSDSIVMVNQLGLMGEKYVEIIPGVDTKNFFENGQTIIGQDPIAQELLSARVWEVATQVESTVKGLSKIINDEKNAGSISSALEHLSSLSGGLDTIVSDVKQGKGNVGKLFYDEALYDDLQGLTADLKANPWKLLHRPAKERKSVQAEIR